jgi:hypothetical protein
MSLYLFTGSEYEEEGESRYVLGSSLGYPFTDLIFGMPPMSAATLYSNVFLPENLRK